MCTEKWVPAKHPRGRDDGHYEKTKDCGKCNCALSSTQHSPAYRNGNRYCTRCLAYY